MAKVLVVGGAGYVGSATCAWLIDQGHEVWVLDDLSTGSSKLLLNKNFRQTKAGDAKAVSKFLSEQTPFDCVMHFAARSLVGESHQKREEYRENNVEQTRRLIGVLQEHKIRNFIFSSSCAIFGDPGDQPIDESLPKNPLSPYGENKLEVEGLLERRARDAGLRSIALRYFNAAGAEPQLRVGESHEPETHLIPRLIKSARLNQTVEIFGTDYPTPDGTCIRDYIHVWDLAAAHEAAMSRLLRMTDLPSDRGLFEAYNLGSGTGFSVREVIQGCEEVTGKKLTVCEMPRRPGDPPRLVANSGLAQKVLGLSPRKTEKRSDLREILSSAWEWEKKRSPLKAVFLDRDGTLNEDPGYLHDPSLLRLLPRVGESLALLKKAGFLLVVVSNQSGVGRGLIDPRVMPAIHQKLDDLLKPWNVRIDHYELCFHHPEQDCVCRKPKPLLLEQSAQKCGIPLLQSYMIGDKASDLDAGRAAGCQASILVQTGHGKNTQILLKDGQADFVAPSLWEAAHWILNRENASS